MKIYVASSFKNRFQPFVVEHLRLAGHEVYDFRTAAAFSWSSIDENWRDWNVKTYMEALVHPLSNIGFTSDINGVNWCDACVLVLPCGLSAGIEAGIIHGSNRPVICYVPELREAELMVKAFTLVTENFSEVLEALKHV
jgi:hypothetical protein